MVQYRFKIYSWSPYDVYMQLLDGRPEISGETQKKTSLEKTTAPFYAFYNIKGSSISKQTQNPLGPMLLDFLIGVKNYNNPYLSFRRSCREGICGSCAMNYNGKNVLACTTEIDTSKTTHVVHPLPHLPVLRDLVVDLNYFYLQHKTVQPWLKRFQFVNFNLLGWFNKVEIIHSKKNRSRLDGLYECILCACCSTSCPSYWWNQTEYLGPAILLQTYRWLIDSRDVNTFNRLSKLYDPYKVFRCHSILNCTKVCPKGLNPALAIHKIKVQLDRLVLKNFFV